MEMSGGSGGGLDGYANGSTVGFSFDIDSAMLEPYQRCRANTWHGRARVDDRAVDDDVRSNRVDSPAESCDSSPSFVTLTADTAGGLGPARVAPRKPASRKNAWGNLSYADLITQAIESSPEKRLTLAQIYDWMVTNVPFFKDKGDSNSSAGWKNSIRHNLSLHSRFMRVQNEGAGKSSWWVVNPDALARNSKTSRRPRAFTMDTKAVFERQKRGRAQRLLTRAPASATVTQRSATSTDSSSLVTEEPRDPFGLEYRSRASSFGGRLSPIDARPEPETADSMDYLPLVQCHYDVPQEHFAYVGDGQETLSETLADILAGDLNMSDISSLPSVTNPPSQPGYIESGYNPTMSYLHPVDFYRGDVRGCSEPGNSNHGSSSDISSSAHYGCVNPGGVENMMSLKGTGIVNRALNVDHVVTGSGSMPNLSQLLTAPPYRNTGMSRMAELKPKSCMFESYHQPHLRDIGIAQSEGMTVKASSCGMVPDLGRSANHDTGCYGGLLARPNAEERPAAGPKLDQTTVARILAERPHLMGKMQKLIQLKRQQLAAEMQQQHQFQPHYQHQQPVANHRGHFETDFQLQASCTTIPPPVTTTNDISVPADTSNHSSNMFFPSDLDLNGVEFSGATMDCDIDQVIRHELALDGKLDFMFDSLPTPTK